MIREATPTDVPEIVRLVHALAAYERSADQVELTDGNLADALFGPNPRVFALVADEEGAVVGMAIYFVSFSTWTGRHGVYLEDLFVDPDRRRRGWGRRLLVELAARAVELGDSRLEWAVLDWNEPAIAFYRSLGAGPMDEWTTFRLSGGALGDLARS